MHKNRKSLCSSSTAGAPVNLLMFLYSFLPSTSRVSSGFTEEKVRTCLEQRDRRFHICFGYCGDQSKGQGAL
ncbi:hypothetical protein POUND7_019529 [Theobroma cacao]